MRTKTAYREIQPDNSAQNIPAEPATVISAPPEAPVVAVEPPVTAVEVDASLALQQQLQKLQESEQLQRQRAPQQLPQTREQKLHLCKQQGLTDAEANFLQQHPAMIDNPQVAAVAANEALAAGHERDSEEYWKA